MTTTRMTSIPICTVEDCKRIAGRDEEHCYIHLGYSRMRVEWLDIRPTAFSGDSSSRWDVDLPAGSQVLGLDGDRLVVISPRDGPLVRKFPSR